MGRDIRLLRHARVSVGLANAATAQSHRSSRGGGLCPGKHAGLLPRGPASRRHLGRDRRQADGRWRADRDARRVARSGRRGSIGWWPRRRAPSCRRTCRPSRRRSPASPSWAWAAMSRSSPARAARPRPRASTVETLRRCWPAASAGAAAVELQGRLAGRGPRGGAGIRARPAARRARARTGGRAPRRWARSASTPTASKLTAPWAVDIKQAGYVLGVYTINDGEVARALVGMGVDCVITDAPDVILAALG